MLFNATFLFLSPVQEMYHLQQKLQLRRPKEIFFFDFFELIAQNLML